MREVIQMTRSFWRWTLKYIDGLHTACVGTCEYVFVPARIPTSKHLCEFYICVFFSVSEFIAAWILLRITWWVRKKYKMYWKQTNGALWSDCGQNKIYSLQYFALRQHFDHFELPCDGNRNWVLTWQQPIHQRCGASWHFLVSSLPHLNSAHTTANTV